MAEEDIGEDMRDSMGLEYMDMKVEQIYGFRNRKGM